MHLFQSVDLYHCDKAFIYIMSSFAVQVIEQNSNYSFIEWNSYLCNLCYRNHIVPWDTNDFAMQFKNLLKKQVEKTEKSGLKLLSLLNYLFLIFFFFTV